MSDQKPGGIIPYPTGAARRLARLPVYLYRLGLGNLLSFWQITILTTRGHRTGLLRHTPLEYRRHGSKLYVVSGWGERPHWVRNLQAEPNATIRMGSQVYAVRAQMVDNPAEVTRALYMFWRTAPIYQAVLARMSSAEKMDLKTVGGIANEFTIMRLDMQPEKPTLASIETDPRWVRRGLVGLLAVMVLAAVVVLTRSRRNE